MGFTVFAEDNAKYWDALAGAYQEATTISVKDFHYGPLLPGDGDLQLLPRSLTGMRCLELGCGAAQNSVFLARQGAEVVAMDVSARQLEYARKVATGHRVEIDLHHADMEQLDDAYGEFDLIHSAYGVPFAADPAALIRRCADRLRPGGTLLVSLGHPVYAGEWLELDENERGIFLSDYFHPSPDVRESAGESESAVCVQAYPIAESLEWFLQAGLQLTGIREPRALPVHELSREDRRKKVPYYSPEWAEQVFELQKFPIVLIVRAQKPDK